MKLSIQKFMMLFAAAISLLQIPISHANGLDARLRDDMQAKHYEPGGKYHLFGNARGSVKNRVYAVQTFDATAVGPILPITHERTGFEGIIGYETHFSGHGHEVHSPFDNHDSKSTSDFSGGVDGGFTVYQLHRTGSEIHPEDGYDGPQGSDYPPPGGARDIYSYYVKGTSTKTKSNIVPRAPFSDRWLKENAGAASGFFSRADEAGKLIWESDPNKNWWANRMDDIRGIVQGAVNPFLMGFQGVGIGAITDSAVSPVTDTAAQQTLQGINHLGNLSPEAQLAAATALQDSAFAVKDGINSARQWADAHPNITATAQTALSVAEAAGTVWRGKKVELNPTKWDWVKNTGYKKPAVRHMQTKALGTVDEIGDTVQQVGKQASGQKTSGGNPAIDSDPYSPSSVAARIETGKVRSDLQIKDILSNTTQRSKTKGPAVQYDKVGDYNDALNDFNSLNVRNVQTRPNGTITGNLPDRRAVNARNDSSGGEPTLEITISNNRKIKIRYGNTR